NVFVLRAYYTSWTFAPHFDVGWDTLRGELLHIFLESRDDVVRILVGNEAHRNFGRGFCWNDRLRTGCNKSAGHSVDFQRWAGPGPVQNRIAGLPRKDCRSYFSLAVVLRVEWQSLPGLQFVPTGGLHVFVKTRNQDFALSIFQVADDLDQSKERIRRNAAVHAGMQVRLCSHRFYFCVNQPSESHAK